MHRLLRRFAVAATLTLILGCGASQQPPAARPEATPATAAAVPQAATTCDNLIAPPDTQFPPHFDYPQKAETVEGWVANRQGHRTRLHAYCLFAGLNQFVPGTSTPTWRTWGTTTQAFPTQYNDWPKTSAGAEDVRPVTINEVRNQAGDKEGGPDAIVNPPPVYNLNPAILANPAYSPCVVQGSLKDGATLQSNGDILIAAVSYNAAALKNILDSNLYNAALLDNDLPAGATNPPATIDAFPSDSIVLKVMLWPVAGDSPSSVTALPVWDWDANAPGSPSDGQYAGYEIQKFWSRAVAIASTPVLGTPTADVRFLYGVLDSSGKNPLGPNTYPAAPVVSLDRFYGRKYTQRDLDAMMKASPCDRAIIDASAYWAYNRAFQAGDALVLVAMHIMTKEQSDWTFQSAWWHPDAFACAGGNRFCGHRPASVPGGDTTWKNYMITTTYGMPQQGGKANSYTPPSTKGAVLPVAYNPYIELAASHPITTNCMNCHHRAAWPPQLSLKKPDRGRFSSYLQASPANPNALETFDTGNPVFNGLLMVDSMWAISDRAGYPAPR